MLASDYLIIPLLFVEAVKCAFASGYYSWRRVLRFNRYAGSAGQTTMGDLFQMLRLFMLASSLVWLVLSGIQAQRISNEVLAERIRGNEHRLDQLESINIQEQLAALRIQVNELKAGQKRIEDIMFWIGQGIAGIVLWIMTNLVQALVATWRRKDHAT